MFKMPDFKLKPFLLVSIIVVISISFLVLKIKQEFKARDFVDENKVEVEKIDNVNLSVNYNSYLKKFASLDDFSSFIEKNQSNFENNYLKRSSFDLGSMDMSIKVSESLDSSMSAGVDFSTTNIQVQGVDEADIIKTDGNYIYYVSGQNLYILNSYPPEDLKILSKIEFDSHLSDIYIKDDVMVVFGNKNNFFGLSKELPSIERASIGIMPPYHSSTVFLQVFDISDRENPIKEKDLEIDGSYFNSRLVGNHLYFLVNNYNYYDKNLPKITYQGNKLDFNCQTGLKCISADIFYFNDYYENFNLTNIVSLDLSRLEKDPKFSFYLLPAGQNIYVSKSNLYITYTKYLNEYNIETDILSNLVYLRLSERDRNIIDEINSTSENILSLNEKRNKIRRIVDTYINFLSLSEKESLELEFKNKLNEEYPNILDDIEKTVIHKLNIFEGFVEPLFMAEVSGHILNQFSMDEFDGFFRIATTRARVWSRFSDENLESDNNLFILDSDLKLTGSVRELAEGERIYSVRFMEDKAYIVTFKETDPLFSIDLKDPYNPKVLGELKIPGFSNYLHPYDNKTLIGFGKDVFENENGRFIEGGLKLSLFDVSSDTPVEVDNYIFGDSGSYSVALHDHRAFLFSKEKNILALPVILREKIDDDSWGQNSFNGLMVFSIIDNKFVLRGQIDHKKIQDKINYYNNSVRRSLYIKEYLYSLSNDLLKINNLENLEEIHSLELN